MADKVRTLVIINLILLKELVDLLLQPLDIKMEGCVDVDVGMVR